MVKCARRSLSLTGVSATHELGPTTSLPSSRRLTAAEKSAQAIGSQEGMIFKCPLFTIPFPVLPRLFPSLVGAGEGSLAWKAVLRRECFPFGAKLTDKRISAKTRQTYSEE